MSDTLAKPPGTPYGSVVEGKGIVTRYKLPELVPARMLNEQSYCPRLAYLEWVQRDFADNADTVDGSFQHRRVNRESGDLPPADAPAHETFHARSVELSSPTLGLIARMDLIEAEGKTVTPIDYKRSRAPDLPEGAWEPERVQLCVQAMLLEEHGYTVPHGELYFVASKRRVPIAIDAALRARTLELLAELRANAELPHAPPPLVDSPKCPRCSLVGICLPDETNLLREAEAEAEAAEEAEAAAEAGSGAEAAAAQATDTPPPLVPHARVRSLVPARDDALPLYVHTAGTRVGRTGSELVIEPREGEKQRVRIGHTSHLALFGNVQITTQAIQDLCDRGINIAYLSSGGWLKAITRGMDHKNVELRRAQFAAAASPDRCLTLAKSIVAAKIRNSRTIIRRNATEPPPHTLLRLRELAKAAEEAESLETLLGLEGTAARLYFQAYAGLLQPPVEEGQSAPAAFDFEGRNRRPPKDPVNCMLSMGYALLVKDLVVAAMAVGFDPYMGFYHQPRYGRPALALDMMEELRPIVVDSIVLSAINTGALQAQDFLRRAGAVTFTNTGKSKFLRAYERRMDEEITHPIFQYRISYRRILEVQLRLLARVLTGELTHYPPFTTR